MPASNLKNECLSRKQIPETRLGHPFKKCYTINDIVWKNTLIDALCEKGFRRIRLCVQNL